MTYFPTGRPARSRLSLSVVLVTTCSGMGALLLHGLPAASAASMSSVDDAYSRAVVLPNPLATYLSTQGRLPPARSMYLYLSPSPQRTSRVPDPLISTSRTRFAYDGLAGVPAIMWRLVHDVPSTLSH